MISRSRPVTPPQRFGKTARLVETKVTDVMKELERRRARGAERSETARSPSSAPERSAVGPEALGCMDRHQGAGTREPDAAPSRKNGAGRERLAALLADFARTAERSPAGAGPDVDALRRRLGI